jgi:sarcosine oxidase gamma subunit
MFRRTLQQLFSRKTTRNSRSSPSRLSSWNRYRLRIDLLEDRVLPSATLMSDHLDYAPGSTATLTGSGFAAGEMVDLQVVRTDGGSGAAGDFTPWHVVANAHGAFTTNWYVATDLAGASLKATASGESSHLSAQALFTDSPGSIKTTDSACNIVDGNHYATKADVYVALFNFPDGDYYIQVTDPGGTVLGTSVGSANPTPIHVVGGVPDMMCYQVAALVLKTSDNTPGFDDSSNGEYKVNIADNSQFTNPKNDNFAVFTAVTISGHKFNDVDGNPATTGDDVPLQGWVIDLGGTTTATATTDANGFYHFDNIGAGTYTLTEELQSGWTQTFAPTNPIVPVSGVNVTNQDFGNFQFVTISGHKFNDVDGNPQTTNDDVPLQGWVIHLNNGQTDQTATTDSNGFYEFDNVGPGTYTLSEDLQSGWTQTFAPNSPITTQSGQNLSNEDFGNFQDGSIAGVKFNDLDGSGIEKEGDPPVGGVVIDLFKNGGATPFETATTANDGTYSFTDLGPGNYTAQEEVPGGSTETFGNAGYSFSPLTSGTNSTGNDFGNFQNGSIAGLKFNDLDGSGIEKEGDPPVGGVVIDLFKNGGATPFEITTTANDGTYSFTNLGPSTYFVQEEVPSGSTETFGNAGYTFDPLNSGADSTGNDFGNFQNGSISGRKFDDVTGNGTDLPGDPGVGGVVIDLFQNGGNTPFETTTTASDGSYSFNNLGPGNYTVQEELPSNSIETFGNAGYSFTPLAGGTESTNNDFGNFKLITISGTKFENHDGDGGRAPGDEGLQGWVITLDGTTTTTTDANGNYSFTGVGPGTHTVQEVQQSGWTQTKGGPGPGGVYTIVAQSGTDVSGEDFGNFHNGSISGRKFNDLTGSGIDLPGDPGVGGVVIDLFKNDGTTPFETTTTANDGTYSFTNLGPGTYTVQEEVPGGSIETFGNAGYTFCPLISGTTSTGDDFGNFQLITVSGHKFNDILGDGPSKDDLPLQGWVIHLTQGNVSLNATTDANGSYEFDNVGPGTYTLSEDLKSGWQQTYAPSAPITAQSGQDVSNQDFGNFQLITISGHKFNDVDDKPLTKGDDVPLAGWVIHLNNDETTQTATTDVNGFYHFDNLGPGTYTLSEDLQTGWIQTFAPANPLVAKSGSNISNQDFGNFHGFTVAGVKFNDHNGNGVKDTGDEGLAGWQIMMDGNVVATTGANGAYSIPNVLPGQHTFQEVQQSGWKETRGGPNGFTFTVVGNLAHLDFGNFKLITISGTKFEDHDGDGGRSPIDEGLQGWLIKLDGIVKATTDSNGNYSLPNIGPGTHIVQEVPQAGWIQTKGGPNAGAYSIVAQSGVDVSGEDFGNFKLVTISGTKFEDHNGNGVRNLPTDQGLAGWLIMLDGVVKATTNANGVYSISGVGPGTHNVAEVPQTGWKQTKGGGGPDGAYQVTTSSGTNVSGDDFGNFKLVTIAGTVFEDHNASNSRDAGDEGLAGWVIRLDGQSVATTDSNGQYTISGVGPGNHSVQEVLQTGYTETLGFPLGFFLTMSSGTNISSKDFGDFKNVTFSGTAFEDHNGNTMRDAGDQGLAGWHILLDGNDVTTTDSNGQYTISNIGPRNHTLQEVRPAGWSGTLGRTGYGFATVSGVDVTRDFGNFKNVTFSGTVFEDHNGNSILDPGDEGLAGWQIFLDGKMATTTDANGKYSIPGVMSGAHTIQEVNQAGYTATLGANGYAFATTSGVNVARLFGNFKNITVSGQVFYDKNGSGVLDSGEPGLGGWVIRIVDGNNKLLKATTASDGTYSISGVGPGIQTLTEIPQMGFTQTSKNPAAFRAQSGINVSGANFGNVTIGQGGGQSIPFWTGSSGQAIYNSNDLAGLHLVQDNGSAFVPGSFASFKTWVLSSGLSGNNAYQLSVQLALAQLNVANGFIDPTESVFVGAIPESAHLGALVVNGYANIQALITNANNFLADPANDVTVVSSPARTYEEALKMVLSAINGNFKITVLPPPP